MKAGSMPHPNSNREDGDYGQKIGNSYFTKDELRKRRGWSVNQGLRYGG